MSRPCKNRMISSNPGITFFKPAGISGDEIEINELMIDEFESIRLCDYMELSNIEGAEKMGISASTFNRLVMKGRKKIADTIVNGKAIKIFKNNDNKKNVENNGE